MRIGCLPLLVGLILAAMLPWVFVDVFTAALLKLGIDPRAATLIVMGILGGAAINIPVRRIAREEWVPADPFAMFRWGGARFAFERSRRDTIIAINVGGCLIPAGLAVYETVRLVPGPVLALGGAVLLNVGICYLLARPVRGIGIVMPGLVPPLMAASSAWLLAPEHATPVAFVAGTLGPLIGADLLHLREVRSLDSGLVSVGGAGTFDGILLSGIVALYLA